MPALRDLPVITQCTTVLLVCGAGYEAARVILDRALDSVAASSRRVRSLEAAGSLLASFRSEVIKAFEFTGYKPPLIKELELAREWIEGLYQLPESLAAQYHSVGAIIAKADKSSADRWDVHCQRKDRNKHLRTALAGFKKHLEERDVTLESFVLA
jgi:hypothetical protein